MYRVAIALKLVTASIAEDRDDGDEWELLEEVVKVVDPGEDVSSWQLIEDETPELRDDVSSTTGSEEDFVAVLDRQAWLQEASQIIRGKVGASADSRVGAAIALKSPILDVLPAPVPPPVLYVPLLDPAAVSLILTSANKQLSDETLARLNELVVTNVPFSPTLHLLPSAVLDIFALSRSDPRSCSLLVIAVTICSQSAMRIARQSGSQPMARFLSRFASSLPPLSEAVQDFGRWLRSLQKVIKVARNNLDSAIKSITGPPRLLAVLSGLQAAMRRVREYSQTLGRRPKRTY